MWHKIKIVFVASVLTLSVGMTVSSTFAQGTARDEVGSGATTVRTVDDNKFDLGWIGLAGLVGLIGLMPRDRQDNRGQVATR